MKSKTGKQSKSTKLKLVLQTVNKISKPLTKTRKTEITSQKLQWDYHWITAEPLNA